MFCPAEWMKAITPHNVPEKKLQMYFQLQNDSRSTDGKTGNVTHFIVTVLQHLAKETVCFSILCSLTASETRPLFNSRYKLRPGFTLMLHLFYIYSLVSMWRKLKIFNQPWLKAAPKGLDFLCKKYSYTSENSWILFFIIIFQNWPNIWVCIYF